MPDIPKLVKFARGKLRTKFLNADMGITRRQYRGG